MRGVDFTSWESILSTLVGLALVTLIGVGLRVVMMLTLQQRRERQNRQINERLRALIGAYKTLGGSFTGDLSVDPRHRRDARAPADAAPEAAALDLDAETATGGSERARRIRDAVEAALSDIVLLGTQDQVRLAAAAAAELAVGRPVHTQTLVASLRDYIRAALDLEPTPADVVLPPQGPARPSGASGKGRGDGAGEGKGGGRSGGGGGMGGAGLGGAGMGGAGLGGAGLGGAGLDGGAGAGLGLHVDAQSPPDHPGA